MGEEPPAGEEERPARRARRQKAQEFREDRRDAIKGMGLVAVTGMLTAVSGGVLATLFSGDRARARAGRFPLAYAPPPSGEVWYKDLIGQPVKEQDILPGDWALAVADGSGLTRPVLLIRLASPPSDPDGAGGFLDTLVGFYSGCVHACCGVTGPVAGDGQLYCPCHASKFDPSTLRRAQDSGRSYFGAPPTAGPAQRPLPLAPIAIDAEGRIELVIETRNREWYGYC